MAVMVLENEFFIKFVNKSKRKKTQNTILVTLKVEGMRELPGGSIYVEIIEYISKLFTQKY